MSDKITLASSQFCGPCKVIKDRIKELNLDVTIRDMEFDIEFFKQAAIRSVPMLFVDGGEQDVVLKGAGEILEYLNKVQPKEL